MVVRPGPMRYSRRVPTEKGVRAMALRGSLAPLAYLVGCPPSLTLVARESRPAGTPKPRLLDRVREAIRARHYSARTEKAYVHWIRRFIFFHGKRHPAGMGAAEVTKFLTSLAVDARVAASTQNQALSALLFLYKDVLEVDLPWLDGVVRAKRPARLPVVLTRDEVRPVLQRLEGPPRLMACLLYGAGLRVLECCRLRVQDVDFAANQIVVRGGKGDKDRVTMLPAMAKPGLVRHLEDVRAQHQADLAMGAGWVEPPTAPPALVRDPSAGRRPRHPNGPGTPRAPGRQHDDDLHACPEPRPGRRPQPGRPDVCAMTRRAAFAGACAKIRCTSSQPIRASSRVRDRSQGVETMEPDRPRAPHGPIGIGRPASQGLPEYADRPIPSPNCSCRAGVKCGE